MARTIVQLHAQYVNKKAWLNILSYNETYSMKCEKRTGNPGIEIAVVVLDVRHAYGTEQALVKPLRSKGSIWVKISDKLTIVNDWVFDEDEPDEAEYKIPTLKANCFDTD